ncbi:Inner membrane protein ygjV [Candidatus Sodalis pierantonius str. SOPE]|uniref:Inner membrane protein ygjV n=1 Tax=Candidatus Sodalis pierantonii str. SOPE TaxID=2342 RepID=W0HMH4_9GAMM|nr:YgjV family protein [Candidatus Sodalis pierantonius]AHF75009.1 Inner membrane protein ygjV [Candidatus Sodalis pierantonius str. SOPE]
MTLYWFAQAVGGLAFVVGITTFFNRNERRFKLQLALYSLIIGLHFFLMGANAAGMSAVLNTLRTLVSTRTRSVWAMLVFIALTLGLGLPKVRYGVELLPIVGTVASTWALFRCSGLTTRCVMWCSTACWVTHNIWLGSIGGSLIEGSFLIMNGLAIVRFHRLIKQGIDPFVTENRALPVQVPGR